MGAEVKIAYLKGLIEGQDLCAQDRAFAKVLPALLESLDALAEDLDASRAAHAELREYVDQLEEDMSMLEEQLRGNGLYVDEPDEGDDLDEEEFASVKCPHCLKDFFYEVSAYNEDEDLLCPHCGEPFNHQGGD